MRAEEHWLAELKQETAQTEGAERRGTIETGEIRKM